MQRPQREIVTLDDILITQELSRRSPRSPNLLSENQALHTLARQLVNQPEIMLQSLVDIALELCSAGTAGVSLLEVLPSGEEIFRWNVLAGTLKQYVGGSTPRNFSPCGVCLERSAPVLFSHPERYFTYFQEAKTPVVEGLVLPLIADNHALGTIWIMSHDEQRHFDAEDVRVMTSLADFTAAALLLNQRQTQELLAKNAQLEALVVDRQRAEESARESEAYFRAIVNLVPDMLWRNDTTGDTSWYNQRWLDYTGQTMEEAQGYGWLEVIHPGDRAQSLTNFQNAVDERRPLRQEHRIRGTDGNYRWFQVQAEPVFDSDGRIIQWFGAATDIHEQRTAIEQSHESEQRLRALIENLPGGAAFVVDRNLRYLLAEGEALYAAGFKREDLVGKTIFEAMPPELTAKYEELYRMALLGESFEHEHNAHDRTYVSRGTPLRSANGDVYGVLAVSYDITARKAAEAALRESEGKYRSLFNSMDEGYVLLDVIFDENDQAIDALYLDANPAATRINGTELVGRRICELIPNVESQLFETFSRVAKTGIGERHEFYTASLDTWYNFYMFKVGEPNNRQVAAVYQDVTDRKRTEEQLRRTAELDAFRVTLSDGLRLLTDPVEIQAQACRILGEHLSVDRAYYVEVNEVESYARVNQDYLRGDSPSLVGVFRLVDYGWIVPLLRRGEIIIVADAEHSDIIPAADRTAMAAVKIASHISTPLLTAGTLVGALCVTECEPRQWSEMDIELVRETAERIWAAVERTCAEAALRKSEEQFRIFVTASSDIVYKMSADWHEMRNLEGKNILASTENPSQTWIETYIPQAEQQRVWTAIQESIRTKSTFELEHQVIQHDGTIGWTFSRAIPMLNEQGEIIEWFGAASDVTARKQAQANQIQLIQEQAAREEERQRAESLAELDRAKTLFFSNVSHEFRTPLTLLLAPLQDALSDSVNPLAPPHRERLELAHRNAMRLLKLVNTLLDFSRIEAGRMEAVYETTDLPLLTTELASVFRSAIERAGLRLIVDCPPLPKPVYVDREMWEKIVLNLLSNAFKFTLEGEIAVRLHPADDHHVRLQVQDTGTGIPPEELPHLFERFYQIRGAKARTHEGSGIGLALVHELIRLHGGTVDVSSTVGQGSCFTVTIPLGTAHLPNDRLRLVVGDSPTEMLRERITATRTQASTAIGTAPYVEEAERWLPQEAGEQGTGNREELSTPSDSDPPQPPFLRGENSVKVPLFKGDLGGSPGLKTVPTPSPARVLLVDDNADMRDYLTRILSEHNEVIAVADGAAALAAAQERVPDLVLSDVMMPGLDGFELLEALRAEPCTREIPIILLSARAGEESVIEGLQVGADDYLIKPFSAQELVSRVNAHLQMAHLRLEALRQEKTTSRRKDEMLSIVSHELNTPLVAILGWTRLLRTSPLNQSMLMKSLETIERNATLQAKLISDLLDISRITAGKLHLNLEPVELQLVIEMAIATVNQTAQTKDIQLSSLLEPLPIIIQGDPERLQQIVLNLLTNAIKFTPKGGRIEVRLDAKETHAQIVVSDTGCGIGAEFLPYVFDSFRQAESSSSTKGLGLGLAIARHLVELHSGTIYVESPGIGQGAIFNVKLPLIGANL